MSVPAVKQQAATRRVSLGSNKAEKIPGPFFTMLFGVEGIGKSSFGADCPEPKVIDLEDRTRHIAIPRVPKPEGGWTWTDTLDAIRLFETEPHDRKTLVIDTLDELESLLWAHMCKRDGKANIEAYGYGKGFNAALDEWRVFVAAVERVQAKRDMNILLNAHCVTKTFKNPEGPDYDRYQPKLNDKAAGYIKGKVYDVLFAIHETYSVKEDERDRKGKGTDTGKRLVLTQRTAGHDAKNSHNLPERMDLDARAYVKAVHDFYMTDTTALRSMALEAIAKMKPAMKEEAEGVLKRADTDQKLGQLIGWARNNAA